MDLKALPLKFLRSINMSLTACIYRNNVSKLWFLSPNKVTAHNVVSCTDQQITCDFNVNANTFRVSFVYASVVPNTRRTLWDSLRSLATWNGPWLVIGDFNAIMGTHEKLGRIPPSAQSCEDFSLMIQDCNLITLNAIGSAYTWARKIGPRFTACRLDRALCNEYWFDLWASTSCYTLPRINSDHNPIYVVNEDTCSSGPSPFRFKNMWTFMMNKLSSPPRGLFSQVPHNCI